MTMAGPIPTFLYLTVHRRDTVLYGARTGGKTGILFLNSIYLNHTEKWRSWSFQNLSGLQVSFFLNVKQMILCFRQWSIDSRKTFMQNPSYLKKTIKATYTYRVLFSEKKLPMTK